MKKKIQLIFPFILIFYSNIFFAQQGRFYYDFKYKIDTTGTSEANDLLVLLVDEQKNIFLSSKFVEIDSLNSLKKYERQYINPQYNVIIEYKKNNDMFTTYKKIDMNYYKYNFKRKINWKTSNETKTILGFNVQKAVANYGGRNWIAWFCKDIPLQYGPHVFYGLPGLILEVHDDSNNFSYTLVKTENHKEYHSNFDIKNIFDQKVFEIKEKDWKIVQLNYYNNPLYNYKTIGWVMYNKNGEKFTTEDYRELEIRTKSELKRYNNPIELSEKINYK
ncbi:GLPGLI family protein [Amniculibacterium aquaticum]|uniref:GLPGLI family protein n=1 Tax=Amniculibacterium aquaticum TaxID=2479858 RepID=UPI000F5B0DA4|nr:GLPGLI family protein [Amniculibacterium aquaticum]